MAKIEWNSEGYTVRYLCPQCGCSHVINVGIIAPDLPRWEFNRDFDRPTLKPSVNVVGRCHHHITDGRIEFCDDACNRFKNQTFVLEEIGGDVH